jgi:glucose-fructose oxidoreductase
MHRAYVEAAAAAGVHVLCEKPMAFNEADCEAMIQAAEDGGVKLMIAYRLHFERGNLESIEVIKSGKIGEPRIFTSVFSQQVKKGNSRLKKDIGGGPLYDMGVYCINAARYLFGAEPLEVFGWNIGSDAARFSEVSEMTSGILRFPGDRVASFTSSFGAADRSVFEVVGTKGVLKMDPAYEMADDLKTEITINGKTTQRTYKKRDQFAPELIYFSDCILENKQPQPSGREGLADVRVIEALIKSVTSNRPVEIRAMDVPHRPSIEREISKPPVAKAPALVKAAAPGAGD